MNTLFFALTHGYKKLKNYTGLIIYTSRSGEGEGVGNTIEMRNFTIADVLDYFLCMVQDMLAKKGRDHCV